MRSSRALVVTSGCTHRRPHVPTPRETLLDETLALEDELLAAYDAALPVIGPHSLLGRRLAHIRADHATHRSTLVAAGAQQAPGPPASPTQSVIAPGDTRQMLAASESAAATVRGSACLGAPRDLAPLLGSLAASETAHAALLRESV